MRFNHLPAVTVFAIISNPLVAHAAPPTGTGGTPPTTSESATASQPSTNRYSTSTTLIGTLMADPAAKAVLEKHIPEMLAKPGFARAADLTLQQVQRYNPPDLSEQVLAEIDEDLAKIQPKK